ncbi:MAG TPA: MipA/OmpV family protein [Allosphingosinicella sp.]|nr:MipA/OmpV family protein [Allosphingosinicella sp.]
MNLSTARRAAALALSLLAATPALAEAEEEGWPDDRNSLTIGIGGGYIPSYEGSDDYEFTPIGVAFGKVAGFSFATRGTGLSIDLIRDARDAPVSFEFGPLAHVRLDRTSGIKDPQVRALGELDRAFELGAFVGVKKNGLLHKYDSLGFRLTWQKDVSDTHGSTILTPAVEYATPLSQRTYAQLGVQMERVGDGYAGTYFGVTPAGSAASGLPVYAADGGWKNWRASLLLAQALTGDLRHPRLSLFGGVSYSRLKGDFARSPIVAVAGDRDQYFAIGGLSYTF